MINCIRTATSCPFTVFASIFAASGGALFVALYSQFALHLEPCVLCLYQRMPYIAALILALAGFALRNNENAVRVLLALCAFAFMIETGLAAYHTGVERHFWASAVEGCAVPDFSKDPSLLESILTKPAASCSDIAWSDPWLGLSMANYNVVFSLLLLAGCLVAFASMQRQKP